MSSQLRTDKEVLAEKEGNSCTAKLLRKQDSYYCGLNVVVELQPTAVLRGKECLF